MQSQMEAPRQPEAPAAPVSTFFSTFAIQDLRLDQEFEEGDAVPVLTKIPIDKPAKTCFFRVHPDAAYTFTCWLLDLKDTGETYLITPQMNQLIPGLARSVRLYLAVDCKGNPRLIPLPLPDANGQSNQWHVSRYECLKLAMRKWIRMQANKSTGSYDVKVSLMQIEPRWPTESINELVEIATSGMIIDQADHPVIRHLRGEECTL